MLAIVGKATPNEQTGDVEHFLRDFRRMLRDRGRFVYAWSFNPDSRAVQTVRQDLDRNNDVFLYLPFDGRRSRLRMHIVDFYHDPDPRGASCPAQWVAYCIDELQGHQEFNASHPIHLWLLIDAITDLPAPVDLLNTFIPFFRDKYRSWGRNFFAFLRD